MSNDKDSNKPPTHRLLGYRDAADGKRYHYEIGALWADSKEVGDIRMKFNSIPIDGNVFAKDLRERLQEAKDNARDGDRREAPRDDKRGSGKEDRPARDGGPRYER